MVSAPSLVAEMTDSIQDKSDCSNKNKDVIIVEVEVSSWGMPWSKSNVMSHTFCKTEICQDVQTPVEVEHCQESFKESSHMSHMRNSGNTVRSTIDVENSGDSTKIICTGDEVIPSHNAGMHYVSCSRMYVEVTKDKNMNSGKSDYQLCQYAF